MSKAKLAKMTREQVVSEVENFLTVQKLYKIARFRPGTWCLAHTDEMTDEAKETIAKFAKVRLRMIDLFDVKSQNYNRNGYLDAQQIVERKLTVESALKVWESLQ